MKTFHDDGINKLYTEGNNTISSIDDVIAAKDELVKASKEFSSFTGKGEEMDGSVKFIMKTDEVKIEDKAKEEKKEVKEEKKGFFAWLKRISKKEVRKANFFFCYFLVPSCLNKEPILGVPSNNPIINKV